MDELRAGFELAAAYPVCKGFAVGRSLFYSAAEDWFAKDITDAEATARIARNYRELLQTWRDARTSSAAQE
jgi:5-dehydro-2-deoxygluconokinase